MEVAPVKRRRALLLLALAAALPAAQAQTGKWPEKPVRVVVPFVPGGSTDIVARLIAARLSQEFGQQFIVDNRGGGGGSIGAEIVARANPDGYTVIVVTSSYATNAALYKLPYDPVKGIAPISMINTGALILAVNPSMKATNLKEFIELVRAKPGALNFGSPGTGSSPHLAAALFQQMTGTNMVHVPYKGDAPALTDLLGGQIHVMLLSGPVLIPHIKAGRLRALAVTTEQRSPAMPDLPAIGELVPGYSHNAWNGMWGPAGTPREIISRLNQALARILMQPEVQERLRADGREPAHTTPEEFGRVIARDVAKWSKVVKAGNIKVD
jgi:tripartite-type tricarboxylate transporter receptor subunit TctC